MSTLSDSERARVTQAIAEVEKITAAEIRCVEIPGPGLLHVALLSGLVSMLVPGALLLAGWRPDGPLPLVGWYVIDPGPLTALELYIELQAAIFVLVLALVFLPWARFLPRAWREAWVRSAANTQFEALGMSRTKDRTGVLLAVAPRHRTAVVVCDAGIERLSDDELSTYVEMPLVRRMKQNELAGGLIDAIEELGQLLKSRARPRSFDTNELPDQLAKANPALT